jgi:hypothetical protein
MGLLHGRCNLDVLPESLVLLLAAVHSTLALLPSGERLRAQIDFHLAARFPGGVVLHRGCRSEQGVPDVAHCRCEALCDGASEPCHCGSYDAVALAVAMREPATLCFKGCLHVGGARRHARLQGGGHLVLNRSKWFGECQSTDVKSLHADDVAVVQLAHE